MSDYTLEMKNITKTFPGVKALDDVDIKLKKGEVLALVGENGAGKSTLMKIVSGAYPSSSYQGSILIDGMEATFHNTFDSSAQGIEMVYQEVSLILDMSVAENIFISNLPKHKKIIDKKVLHDKSAQLLEQIGLEIDCDRRIRGLSTSQQQMISIAKAISKNPKIIVLDEPTSALTASESEKLFTIINELKEKGISCIYISHKLDEVFQIADRVTVLRDGKTVGTVERRAFNYDCIIGMMVGRSIENMYPKQTVEIGSEVLNVENLTVQHRYIKDKNLVENVSFSLRKGEILGISGLVGSGRSELVNAIFGSIPRKPGCKIMIEGKSVEIKSPIEAKKNGMALVTEDRKVSGIINGMTVRENCTLANLKQLFANGLIHKNKEEEIAEKYKNMLSIKTPSIESRVRNLSGGNQQKVVLAKWLMLNPKVLIMDEPTRGIDVGAKVEIYNIMVELAKKGIGIIIISSELPELIGMCDNILVLSKGHIFDKVPREEFSEHRIMYAATGCNSI